ncbi:hypothetical protein E2C01_003997 [Portunus trituberculatus]|uniref:Uncharacterized protein n=1 Tax=Portunus trituberculatus TaxID=210409 RepID=A0A5B7CRP3_PORTR|nr:hypothetical protein [Portunus trituberculatus]
MGRLIAALQKFGVPHISENEDNVVKSPPSNSAHTSSSRTASPIHSFTPLQWGVRVCACLQGRETDLH